MSADREHKDLLAAVQLIQELTAGLSLPTGSRADAAVGCLDLAIEHQAAIALLYDAELYGAMLALTRVLYESLIRGLWLLGSASEKELENYRCSRNLPHMNQMVSAVESTFKSQSDLISRFHKRAWRELNDYTHTGPNHSARRHHAGRVEANYTEEDIANCLDAAIFFGMLAGAKLASLSGKSAIRDRFKARLEEFANARRPQSS